MSATHEAAASIRAGVVCMALGQVAGNAAAVAAKDGVSPRQTDISRLKSSLRKQGVRVD